MYMDHLLTGSLPGSNTLEEAEEHYILDAMQMDLRERRIRQYPHSISIKTVEKHFDGLKAVNPDIYTTYLYTTARLNVVCSDLTDHQIRRALNGISWAMTKLYQDRAVLLPTVNAYRSGATLPDDMLLKVRDRVQELLPEMIERVKEESQKEIPVRYQTHYGARGEEQVPLPPEHPLPLATANAMLNLRILAYLRHPIDLVREIANWQLEMEHSE